MVKWTSYETSNLTFPVRVGAGVPFSVVLLPSLVDMMRENDMRCGYCCKHLWVMIVDDPSKGIVEDNIIEHKGQGQPCKHLCGDAPGEYSCAIHDEPWYEETPCARHEQVGKPDAPCRMGEFILRGQKDEGRVS